MRLCRNPVPRPQAPHQESDLLLTTTGGHSGGGKSHQEPGREKSYFPEQRQTPGLPSPLSPLTCQALCKHSRLLPGSGCPGAKGWKPFHARAQRPAEPHTEGKHPLRGRRRLGRRGTSQRHPCWSILHPDPEYRRLCSFISRGGATHEMESVS